MSRNLLALMSLLIVVYYCSMGTSQNYNIIVLVIAVGNDRKFMGLGQKFVIFIIIDLKIVLLICYEETVGALFLFTEKWCQKIVIY